ncbi:MAG: DUF4287 domain-containing protein [Anaerolineae bacterium]|jgi:predicted transport protein|nr:DUF4287 domain-containing protein [Anaerolineae bacterium]
MALELDPAAQTMIDNVPEKTGKTLEEWYKILGDANLKKHGEMMKLLKGEHGVTHGFANMIVRLFQEQAAGGPLAEEDLVAAQFSKGKEALKPIYDAIIEAIEGFGSDVEIAPKKTYVSLRRSKQFAIIKPATKTRVDLGFNTKGEAATERFSGENAFGGMCTHLVQLTSVDEVDAEVVEWLRKAYKNAG